jgi:hypothetical protein
MAPCTHLALLAPGYSIHLAVYTYGIAMLDTLVKPFGLPTTAKANTDVKEAKGYPTSFSNTLLEHSFQNKNKKFFEQVYIVDDAIFLCILCYFFPSDPTRDQISLPEG